MVTKLRGPRVCQGDLTLILLCKNGARLDPSACAKCFDRVPKFGMT